MTIMKRLGETMKILILFLLPLSAFSQTIYLPNAGVHTALTGTIDSGLAAANVHITGGAITVTNPSVGVNGAAIPLDSTQIAGSDGTNLQPLSVNSSGVLALPQGAASETTLSSLSSINVSSSKISDAVTPDGPIIPSEIMVVGGSDGTNVHAFTTGTNGNMQVDIVSAPLPSGAATEAKQDTGITALGTINTTLGSPFQAGGSIGNTSFGISGTLPAFTSTPTFDIGTIAGIATETTLAALGAKFGSLGQTTMSSSAPVVIASDQSAIPVTGTFWQATQPVSGTVATSSPLNANASGSAAAATVSTVTTLTAPANAVGFILMNLDTSTTNMRWSLGRTASTTLGQQLQPGRDSGFVPSGANISIIAESGTVNYDVQWISQ